MLETANDSAGPRQPVCDHGGTDTRPEIGGYALESPRLSCLFAWLTAGTLAIRVALADR